MSTQASISRALKAMKAVTGKDAMIKVVNGETWIVPVNPADLPQDKRPIEPQNIRL